jgi:hypothetical protein
MSKIEFTARWKEELVASSPDGKLIFELTMGQLHVYFPDEACWLARAPAWAKDKWQTYMEACQEWCRSRIPISVVGDAYIFEEKRR